MKLRNKKTGEICELVGFNISNDSYKKKFGKKDYYSLQEFCEDWEDYKPTEPLIKDEKIRKAVKVWAEANELEPDFEVRYSESSFTLISWQASIEFNAKIDGLEHNKTYTITELCGEEEE